MMFVVIFTSVESYTDWAACLSQYITGNPLDMIATFGAGDFIALFLNAALVSLAFATVEPIIAFYTVLPVVVPAIWIAAVLITIQACGVS